MPSGSPSLDVGIEHEGLWLLGLAGLVVGAGAFGVALDRPGVRRSRSR